MTAVVPELGVFVLPIVGIATLLQRDDAATFHALRACRRCTGGWGSSKPIR
jgi:hypothetical protein